MHDDILGACLIFALADGVLREQLALHLLPVGVERLICAIAVGDALDERYGPFAPDEALGTGGNLKRP
jgi:hypothetical protein